MQAPSKTLRRLGLWIGVPILLLLAGVGLVFFDRLVPQKHSVTFSFSSWTNDAQSGRVAILTASNHSRKAVMYFGDRNRQPRCELLIVASRQKSGMVEYTTWTNLTQHLWTGHVALQLQPQESVNCLLPWHDQFTNGPITFSYLPEPNLVERIYERVSLALRRSTGRNSRMVPLTGAPWTNAPGTWR